MPFYQFDHFTGRIRNSQNMQPLYPIKPMPLLRNDPPKIVWDSSATKTIKTDVVKQSENRPSTLPARLIAKQKMFQADMSKPVYLMGGTPDKILFGITIACGITCAVLSYKLIAKEFYSK